MEVLCLRVLTQSSSQRFTLGAVSGNVLYLTSFETPIHGGLYSVDLTQPDAEPQVQFCLLQE